MLFPMNVIFSYEAGPIQWISIATVDTDGLVLTRWVINSYSAENRPMYFQPFRAPLEEYFVNTEEIYTVLTLNTFINDFYHYDMGLFNTCTWCSYIYIYIDICACACACACVCMND